MSNKYSSKNIKGSAGIRVNTFFSDSPLDVALRLLRHAVLEVEDAVNDLASKNFNATTAPIESAQSAPKEANNNE